VYQFGGEIARIRAKKIMPPCYLRRMRAGRVSNARAAGALRSRARAKAMRGMRRELDL